MTYSHFWGGDRALAEKYKNGSLVIARMNPTDYHRYHYPITGVQRVFQRIRGSLLSVSPKALLRRFSILWENQRDVAQITGNPLTGDMAMVVVGATFVGATHFTNPQGGLIEKGDEAGYFSFGGSTVVLLSERPIHFDQQLLANTAAGYETQGRCGQALGTVDVPALPPRRPQLVIEEN